MSGAGRVVARHLAVAAGTLVVIRIVGAGWAGGFPIWFPDSSSFLAVARRGPFTGRFWFDERPIGFPLLAWSLGRSVRLIVLAETVLYVVSFGALAAAVAASLRSRLARAAAIVLVAMVATQPRFALWNTHVLSESLTISLGVLALAGWWRFAAGPTRRRLAAAAIVTAGWLVSRDTNVAPIVAAVAPALFVASRRWPAARPRVRRSMAGVALGLLAVAGYVFVSQDVSDRNRYPVMNNVGQRVLPDEGMTEWFVDRGMPIGDALRERTGRSSFDDGGAMLNDPRLAEFRAWADGPGQRVQALSFVLRPGFWLAEVTDGTTGLAPILATDYEQYDLFGVGRRLPTSWWGLGGPRSWLALGAWTFLAAGGVALGARRRRLRPLAVLTATAWAATVVDGYLSFVGDSVETGRHLVGPLCRLTLIGGLGAVLGIEALRARRVRPSARRAPAPAPRVSAWSYAVTALTTTLVLAAVFGNELRAQNFDPQYMRVLVDRTLRYGGAYYANGIHNKGPLEPAVYELAGRLGGHDGFWLAISLIVLLAALGVAAIVAGTAHLGGAGRAVAAAVGAGMAFHLTLSSADYAGTLYARQLTVTLLAAAWAVAAVERCWSSPRRAAWSAAAVGALVGLAVQTLLASVFAGAVVLALAVAGTRRRAASRPRQRWHDPRRTALVLAAGALGALATAPLWYAARGAFDEFWSGWWTYAGFSSSATGRSLAGQFGLAWDQAYAYYRAWPLSLAVLGAFAALTGLLWREHGRRQRQLRLAAGAWIVAAWVELALSQRYSSHYFSILAVPTWLAFALLAADVERLLAGRARAVRPAALVVVATLALVYVGGATPLRDGIARASEFTSVGRLVDDRARNAAPPLRAEQAVLDLVTSPGDPMLAWTMVPWTYLEHDRVAATRFIWKSFLVGEIYLAGSGPQYVLAETWRWFDEDLAESEPLVLHLEPDLPVDPATPFARYVDERFVPGYAGTAASISLRGDVAEQVLAGGTGRRPSAVATVAAGEEVELDRGWCRRVDGELTADAGAGTDVDVVLRDGVGGVLGRLRLAGGTATAGTDTVQYDAVPFTWPAGERSFAVVVGTRSAVLVAGGTIVAAVPLDRAAAGDGGPAIGLTGGPAGLDLDALSTAGSGPLGTSGC